MPNETAANTSKKGSPKRGTLGWLAEICFREGLGESRRAFQSLAPDEGDLVYSVAHDNQGQSVTRTDAPSDGGPRYLAFGPAPHWEPPYSVLRVEQDPVTQPGSALMYHAGEELVAPISGQVRYRFLWTGGGRRPSLRELPPVGPGQILRINPQIPHAAWGTGKQPVQAWMVIRHLSDTPAAISLDGPSKGAYQSRRLTERELDSPSSYALVAWGISEKLRLQLERANLHVVKVARDCHLDPGHLSRLLKGEGNVSIDALLRLARYLRVDLRRLIAPDLWLSDTDSIRSRRARGQLQPLLHKTPGTSHYLHVGCREMKAGITTHVPLARRVEKADPDQGLRRSMSSWILLRGLAVVDTDATGKRLEMLRPGSVIHFHRVGERRIRSLEPSTLLEITYSTAWCPCPFGMPGSTLDAP